MEPQLGRLEDKLDRVVDSMASIDKTLTGQAVQLAEHIRRTDALEKRVEQVARDLAPVKDQVAKWRGGIALVLGMAAIVEACQWWFSR